MIDSFQIFEILKAGSIAEPQARARMLAIQKGETDIALDVKTVLERQFDAFNDRLEARLAQTKTELVRWMFAFWIGQTAATVGLVVAGMKLLK